MGHPNRQRETLRWWPAVCSIPVYSDDDPLGGHMCPNKCPCCLEWFATRVDANLIRIAGQRR